MKESGDGFFGWSHWGSRGVLCGRVEGAGGVLGILRALGLDFVDFELDLLDFYAKLIDGELFFGILALFFCHAPPKVFNFVHSGIEFLHETLLLQLLAFFLKPLLFSFPRGPFPSTLLHLRYPTPILF